MASREMLQWQYKQILAQLEQVELHAGDPTCPCVLAAKGEYCLPKHLLLLESLAAETAAMVEGKDGEMFGDLQGEAEEKHKETKDRIVCHTGKGEPSDLVDWARTWRKKVEPIYYACPPKAHVRQEYEMCSASLEQRSMTKAQWAEALKYQLPFGETKAEVVVQPTCPPVCPSVTPLTPASKKKYELFPFQREGVDWLKGRKAALLADDMGLGKTPQAIHWGADFRPVLVVVPAALLYNWQREIATMWRPQDKVVILDGKEEVPRHLPDWTILSYGMLNHYLPQLKRAGFKALIIDEAHLVKNLSAQRTKNILELVEPQEPAKSDKRIPNRLAVTGTPILNRPIELFALLVFLGVKPREHFQEFLKAYTEHKMVKGRMVFTGAKNLRQLHESLKPFMLRRLKKDVLKNLPPKINTPMYVPISNAAEYQDAERNFLKWLAGKKGDEAAIRAASAEIITKMNSLRQLAAQGKVAPVCDWLKPCRDGQGKVIIFSSFLEPLESLTQCRPESLLYTGATGSADRQAIVDKFQHTSDVCYFMGTVGAAGVGITLTAASRVAFLDLPWTPGAKIQAEDRAHRIGQTKTVEIVNVLAKGTIDERMLQLLASKEFIIAQTIDGKTRDEAMTGSISQNLLQNYLRTPSLTGLMQYEPETPDAGLDEITEQDLEVLEGPRKQTASLTARDFFKHSKLLTLYHATIEKNLISIQKHGLKHPEGVMPSRWFMLTDSLGGAIKYATGDNPIIIRYDIPGSEVGKYLWPPSTPSGIYGLQYGIREPIPSRFITRVGKASEFSVDAAQKKPSHVDEFHLRVSGKCQGEPEQCKFTLKHQGKPIKVTGVSAMEEKAIEMASNAPCAHLAQDVKIAGKCQADICTFKVKAADEAVRETFSIKELGGAIDQVRRQLQSGKAVAASPLTFAMGPTTLTKYELRHRIVEASALIASHNPFTFEPNPGYPPELQPRMRGRSANRSQVQEIAKNLDADALLTDFHSIDRGSPIVGSDNIVESGNGRVMALQHAIQEIPESYQCYRDELLKRVDGFGLSRQDAESMTNPVLVRERLTDVPRRTFVEDANTSATLTPSAIEVARSDALKVNTDMLNALLVEENQGIEDALRSPKNAGFVSMFLTQIPAVERSRISDAKGQLSQDGIRRIAMALFLRTFAGDSGIRLAEKFFEVADPEVRNVFNGLAASLGILARAEGLCKDGQRDADLAIGEDIAATVGVFADIKKTPGMTVAKYLDQSQMFERPLNAFQERLLKLIDERSRSGKKIGHLLRAYASLVIDSPPLAQTSFIPGGKVTKAELLEQAVRSAEQATMMQTTAIETGTASWLMGKIDTCSMSVGEAERLFSWRPLRTALIAALVIAGDGNIQICPVGMIPGTYQLKISYESEEKKGLLTKVVKKLPLAKEVYVSWPGLRVWEVRLPGELVETEKQDLHWGIQQIIDQRKGEPAEQAKMFQPIWCSGVRKAEKEIKSALRSLTGIKGKVERMKTSLETPLAICGGQAKMFEASLLPVCPVCLAGGKSTSKGMPEVSKKKFFVLETHTEDSSGDPLPRLALTRAGAFWRLDRLLSYRDGTWESRWINPDEAAILLSNYNQYSPELFAGWRRLPAAVRDAWNRLPFGGPRFPGALIPPNLEWVEGVLLEQAKPICTSSQLEKLKRCAEEVKAKLPASCGSSEWKKPQGQREKGCYSPFAVCSAKVGCRPGRKPS